MSRLIQAAGIVSLKPPEQLIRGITVTPLKDGRFAIQLCDGANETGIVISDGELSRVIDLFVLCHNPNKLEKDE